MCTPTNSPFATPFSYEHECFISYLHRLPTSHGINICLFYLCVCCFTEDSSPELTEIVFPEGNSSLQHNSSLGLDSHCIFMTGVLKWNLGRLTGWQNNLNVEVIFISEFLNLEFSYFFLADRLPRFHFEKPLLLTHEGQSVFVWIREISLRLLLLPRKKSWNS